jgi:hypothetical protein
VAMELESRQSLRRDLGSARRTSESADSRLQTTV